MLGWSISAILAIALIWHVVHEIRDMRNKEFLAKLMDCTYYRIGTGDYFIPNNENGE